MESTAIMRLKEFAKYAKSKGVVKGENSFEAYCGLCNRYITNAARNGKGSIGSDVIARVSRKFPELNVKWLCTGEGSMINDISTYSEDYKKAIMLIDELGETVKKLAISDTNTIPL